MSYLKGIILGIVQGLTEFLPVSSSGHLALLQQVFKVDTDMVLLFTVLLHVGTLVSVFIVYWRDIKDLVIELVLTIQDLVNKKGLRLDERPVRRLGLMIIVASIPTAIMGIAFGDFFDSLYKSIIPIGVGLIFTGVLLYITEKVPTGHTGMDKINYRNAIFIGLIQGVAICPGISRSGSTLFGSLMCRLDREFAVKFVFLISIPSILGSAILEVPKALSEGLPVGSLGPILAGMLAASISGYIAIKTMIKIVSKKKLTYFSYYVWIVGTFVVFYGIFSL